MSGSGGLTRRSALGLGVAGVALLALGGVGLALRPSALREPPGPLVALDPLEYSIVWALAERICPAHGPFVAASAVGVAEKIDAYVAQLEPATADELKQLLRFVENALPGLVLDGRATTFTASDPAAQDRALENMRTSRFRARRAMFKVLSGLIGASYYAQPEVWAAFGYPGPPDGLRRRR